MTQLRTMSKKKKNTAPETQLFIPLRLDGEDLFLLSADVAAQWKAELGDERFDALKVDAATPQASDPKGNN